MKKIYRFTTELLEYLNLSDKPYYLDFIIKVISEKLKKSDGCKCCLQLEKEDEIFFRVPKSHIPKNAILNFIFINHIIQINKPQCDYFEYYQKPIAVEKN
jgi:hypothetical protein